MLFQTVTDFFHCIQWEIEQPILSFIIRHGSADGKFGTEFLTIGFQTLCFQVDLRLDLYRYDLFPGIDHKIYLTGTAVIGIIEDS